MPGQPALTVLDGRVPRFTPAQVEEALLRLEERAGPVVARVRERTEASWVGVRADLNQVAGGQASPRAMVIAHHALRAHQALELQTLAAARAFGGEEELADKHMRNQAGLAVVATDVLNKAYEAAREDAKNKAGGAVGALFAECEVPGQVPICPPGVGVVGAPLTANPASEKGTG